MPSSFRVQKFLAGLRYPARKHEVLERARSRGADAELISLFSLSCEVGRQVERGLSVS